MSQTIPTILPPQSILDPRTTYVLHLADNALILGHRNSEWTGHGPVLEQDIAISNIALDLIGQARNLYQYAARIIDPKGELGITEDTLAYLRDAWDFRNCLLVEQPNGDWAKTILRQFLFSAYQYYFYGSLQQSADQQLAAIGEKALKEVTYHLRWSGEWVVRLGDGTAESHRRLQEALQDLWPYTGELFDPAAYETYNTDLAIGVDLSAIRSPWMEQVRSIFQQATLSVPEDTWMQSGGKNGLHSEHLGYILADLQFLQRAYPGCTW